MYNQANPYDQDREPNNLPAESRGTNNLPAESPGTNNLPAESPGRRNIGYIDSRIDSSRRRVPNKTLATRRYEAQQAYGGRVPRKRGN